MDRAFGSFEECVQDGVMSACGAYGTAPLDRIYRCIEQRMEKYFDEAGNVVALAQERDWKLNVRRALFTSTRFGIEKAEHSDGLEFFVVDKHQNWFLYPTTIRREESHPVLQERLNEAKPKRVETELKFRQAGHPSSQTQDEDRTLQSPQGREHSCETRSSSGSSEELLTSPTPKSVKDESVSETSSTTKTDGLPTTHARDGLTSDDALQSEGENIQKQGSRAYEHDKKVEEDKCIEQSQQVSYKTELTFHTLCSNLEIGSFPGSLPF